MWNQKYKTLRMDEPMWLELHSMNNVIAIIGIPSYTYVAGAPFQSRNWFTRPEEQNVLTSPH